MFAAAPCRGFIVRRGDRGRVEARAWTADGTAYALSGPDDWGARNALVRTLQMRTMRTRPIGGGARHMGRKV